MIILSEREKSISTLGLDSLAATEAANELIGPKLAGGYPAASDLPGWRRAREAGALSGFPVLDNPRVRSVEVAEVPCRLIEAPTNPASGTYLHFHGGGWGLGSQFSQDERLLALSDATGLAVLSVGYRLAPEHPLPQILADCEAVARAVVAGRAVPDQQSRGFLAIGGESAGAHLSAATLLRLAEPAAAVEHSNSGHSNFGRTGFDAAVLTFGCFDLAGTPSRLAGGAAASVAALNQAILPGADAAELRDPAYSPLFAELPELPPARFLCGTRDPLLDDTLMMAARWRAVAETELDLVAGAIHAFTLIPGATTSSSREAEHEFLRRRIAAVAANRVE